MIISREEKNNLIKELASELNAKTDGSGKNLIVPTCPYCGKEGGKFGIYIGAETPRKKLFVSHCFSCQKTVKDVNRLLSYIGRPDLQIVKRYDVERLEVDNFISLDEEELDDELQPIKMPDGWKRCFQNPYLKSRGFISDDFETFPVGTTRGLNYKMDEYILFPVIDNKQIVGYVGRHTWGRDELEEYNLQAKLQGKYQKLRYKNSQDNNFSKMLYNFDAVIEDVTDTVVLVEGIFDAIALVRHLELYDNEQIAVVATFGKKISHTQMYKLQSKGVRTIVIGWDSDAVSAINKASEELSEYFDVYVARIACDSKDWDEMDAWDAIDIFSDHIVSPEDFKTNTLEIVKLRV